MLVISTTETDWREVPDPKPPQNMTARVISFCTVHNIPRSVGEIVEVDANTFRNLVAKGRIEEYVDIQQKTVAWPCEDYDAAIDITEKVQEILQACEHQWVTALGDLPWDRIAPDAIFTCELCGAEAFKSDLRNPNPTAKRGPGRPKKTP